MKRDRDTIGRRRHILSLREAGLTYAEIGEKLGISGERVRQIVLVSENSHREMSSGRPTLLLRPGEVAALLGIHISTVRRWANEGALRSYRIGKRGDRRFRRDDIENALVEYEKSHETTPAN